MTNTSSEHKKQSILRTLAVLGLIAIIILIAWLSVQIVRVAPSAFSSLASLAEGIGSYEEAIEEVAEPLLVNVTSESIVAGETTTLTWDSVEGQTYSFSYDCTASTTVAVVTEEGIRDIACGERYDLGNDNMVELAITTESESDSVTYTLLAFSDDLEDDSVTGSIAITNPTLTAEVAGETTTATTTEESVEQVEETEVTEEPTEETTQITFAVPVNDPNGFVDLRAQFVGVGTEDGLTDDLERDSSGIFFFSVRNIGTKTSQTWDFSVELPDGITYQSDTQLPLRPNERATLALTIDTDDDSNHNFEVEVDTREDRNPNNNDFSQRVRFTN